MPKITECPQPSRDDLAAQRVAIFGHDPVAASRPSAQFAGMTITNCGPQAVTVQCDGNRIEIPPAPAAIDANPTYREIDIGAGVFRIEESRDGGATWAHYGTSLPDGRWQWPSAAAEEHRPLTFARLLADAEDTMLLTRGAPNATRLWQLLSGLRAEHAHGLLAFGTNVVDMDAVNALFRVFTDGVQPNDTPAIAAALAAKNAKPAPEPVLSIGGSEFDTAELLEALQIVRARKSAPVKETPRGLMTVRDFDHRLGLWNGEV